ncbi:MAG TPA: beta-ketoacyl-ACP reductase [Eubacteriaceae bacterium]|nr:beta-ketoacyl-ACP reductase [Eubacteriaceae bacterium]
MTAEKKLEGKTVLITGAARGIGREYALRLAKLGANIVATDMDLAAHQYKEKEATGENIVEEIQQRGGKAIGFEGDGIDEDFVEKVVRETTKQLGTIDVLINNIGGTGGTGPVLFTEMETDTFRKVIDINLTTTFLFSKHTATVMKKNQRGKIINTASIAGMVPLFVSQPHYSAAKAGVISLTKTMALELSDYGITVNAIAPGYVQTVKWVEHFREQIEELTQKVPLGRLATTEDCAKVIEFLATDLSDYLTGQVFHVDGGLFDLNPSTKKVTQY